MTPIAIGFNNKQPPQQRGAFPHLPTKGESVKKPSETRSQQSAPIKAPQPPESRDQRVPLTMLEDTCSNCHRALGSSQPASSHQLLPAFPQPRAPPAAQEARRSEHPTNREDLGCVKGGAASEERSLQDGSADEGDRLEVFKGDDEDKAGKDLSHKSNYSVPDENSKRERPVKAFKQHESHIQRIKMKKLYASIPAAVFCIEERKGREKTCHKNLEVTLYETQQ